MSVDKNDASVPMFYKPLHLLRHIPVPHRIVLAVGSADITAVVNTAGALPRKCKRLVSKRLHNALLCAVHLLDQSLRHRQSPLKRLRADIIHRIIIQKGKCLSVLRTAVWRDLLQHVKYILLAAVRPLHIHAVKMQILSIPRRLIVSAHPLDQRLHLLCAVDAEPDPGSSLLRSPLPAVNIVIDFQCIPKITFYDKSPAPILLNERLKHLRLHFLILFHTVAGFAKPHHLHLL